MMTSNEANLNLDLTNRTVVTRILKQTKGYKFASYSEGNILDHVRSNQPEFLGAVFRIVQEWYDKGCPVDADAAHEHDFSKWASILNYVLTEILGEPDMFEGYADVKLMLHTPNQRWLLDVARTMLQDNESTKSMQTSDMLKELEEAGNEDLIPGLKEADTLEMGNTARKCATLTGRRMSVLFKDTDEINIENVSIKRTIEKKSRIEINAEGKSVNRGDRETPCYSFEVVKD